MRHHQLNTALLFVNLFFKEAISELIQGFVTRMTDIETEMPKFLKSFLQQYKETLDRIANRIETSNKRYDHQKIQQQINEVKRLVATVPKVIGVKTSHHFGAWSKPSLSGYPFPSF